MPKKKKYTFWICKDCEVDFIVPGALKSKVNCPKCADRLFVEKKKDIWIERPFNYKRPWTQEEFEIIQSGLKLGRTHKQIAEELEGRTENAVRRQVQQLRKKGINI